MSINTNTRTRTKKLKKSHVPFMRLWGAIGKKKQMNLPLTPDLKRIVDKAGGSEFVIKLILRELNKQEKLPEKYRMFLEE